MIKMKNTIIIILLILINCIIRSQSLSDINFMKIVDKEIHQKKNKIKLKKNHSSEYDLFFDLGIVIYKNYVSSQDASSCSFTPSCSIYAMNAIKKEGFLFGYLNFWDRFSRCNSLNKEDYHIDQDNHLLIDPVRNFRYEKIE